MISNCKLTRWEWEGGVTRGFGGQECLCFDENRSVPFWRYGDLKRIKIVYVHVTLIPSRICQLVAKNGNSAIRNICKGRRREFLI